MNATLTTATAPRKARKSAAERLHDHYLKLAILVRQGRLHRLPAGVRRASFTLDGQQIDVYESNTYAGYGYIVTCDDANGYECGCESYQHRYTCAHVKQSSDRAKARYEAAKKQNELDGAQVVAPLVLGEFASDLPAHLDDRQSTQPVRKTDAERRAEIEAYRELYPDDFYSAA